MEVNVSKYLNKSGESQKTDFIQSLCVFLSLFLNRWEQV